MEAHASLKVKYKMSTITTILIKYRSKKNSENNNKIVKEQNRISPSVSLRLSTLEIQQKSRGTHPSIFLVLISTDHIDTNTALD